MERLSLLYASALFDLAMENDAIDEFHSNAHLMRETLQEEECLHLLVHPHISAAEKRDFFGKAFAGQIHDDLLGFLYLVAEKSREAYLLPALAALIERIDRHNKKVTAKVFTAVELDQNQIDEIRTILSAKLYKTVEVSTKIDPSLIGGPYIYVDGYYIDWTIKRRLRDLTIHMKEGCSA